MGKYILYNLQYSILLLCYKGLIIITCRKGKVKDISLETQPEVKIRLICLGTILNKEMVEMNISQNSLRLFDTKFMGRVLEQYQANGQC
jgi:hypothetical protein